VHERGDSAPSRSARGAGIPEGDTPFVPRAPPAPRAPRRSRVFLKDIEGSRPEGKSRYADGIRAAALDVL